MPATGVKLLSDESFQKLLFDLFCVWHDVQRHYDPPITDNEDEKMLKVKQMLCKLLGEIDGRVKRIQTTPSDSDEQTFIEEWSMLTWNVLCIVSRLQNTPTLIQSQEDRLIFGRLNEALISLVNHSRRTLNPPSLGVDEPNMDYLSQFLDETMHILHGLYKTLKSVCADSPGPISPAETEQFAQRLQNFIDENLVPFINTFKTFCTEHIARLWQRVREVQIQRMLNRAPLSHEPITDLVSFYSFQMHRLAILGARIQGFRHELTNSKMFGDCDPVQSLSEMVFSALELLMADCLLASEPSTNPILVTNNLFSIYCGALARGVVFKQFDIQVITEEAAEHVQSEMRRQKILPSPIPAVPSAALLALKPSAKRTNNQQANASDTSTTAHKKTDVNSKEIVTIYPEFNNKNRYWAANKVMLCTTRQKGGRHSANNSFQDLSTTGGFNLDTKSVSGKRPIFYFYIRAIMFSPSGRFADAHTLSLPFTIATRRNQDCQVQRMMSSYTATCFWLFGNDIQDGLMLQWVEHGMSWEKFKVLFMEYFRVHAEVERGLEDKDFDLLQYKIKCNDCAADGVNQDGIVDRQITFKNLLCQHLRYECSSIINRFSVWRGVLELMQLFHDSKTYVRKLWEHHNIHGFLEFDQISSILSSYQSALLMHISFITGGTICFTLKSVVHGAGEKGAPMHLEPLDLKKLQAKSLLDYLRDIGIAEKVKYLINSRLEPVRITDIIDKFVPPSTVKGEQETRISSNVTHSGGIDAMQSITFTAMRIAVVTCKLKPPSDDLDLELITHTDQQQPLQPMEAMQMEEPIRSGSEPVSSSFLRAQPMVNHLQPLITTACTTCGGSNGTGPAAISPQYAGTFQRLPSCASADDEFIRELVQLCNFHGKSKQELTNLLAKAAEEEFASLKISPTGSLNAANGGSRSSGIALNGGSSNYNNNIVNNRNIGNNNDEIELNQSIVKQQRLSLPCSDVISGATSDFVLPLQTQPFFHQISLGNEPDGGGGNMVYMDHRWPLIHQPNTGVFSSNQPNSTNQIWLQQQQQLRQQRSPSLELPKFSIYQSASTTSVASQLFQQPISNSELSGAQQLLKSTVEIRTDRDVNNSGFNDTDDAFSHRVKERRDS